MLVVIGCGNTNREDDGVGVVVAQRLAERLRRHPVPGVRAFDCGTGGMDVMFAARGAEALVVVDACRSGAEPGAVFDVPGEVLESLPEPSFSLHDFRWQHALAAGRRIFAEEFPRDVRVLLVEVERTGLGLELSAPVRTAADRLHERLLGRIAEHAAARHGDTRARVRVRRGSLHLDAALYAQVFDGRDGAVVLPVGGELQVMPVDQVAGGVLVKLRNARGDRVLDGSDALRAAGWDDEGEYDCSCRWDPEAGALRVQAPDVRERAS